MGAACMGRAATRGGAGAGMVSADLGAQRKPGSSMGTGSVVSAALDSGRRSSRPQDGVPPGAEATAKVRGVASFARLHRCGGAAALTSALACSSEAGSASRAGASPGGGSVGCPQNGRRGGAHEHRAVLETDGPVGRLSGTQRRWTPRMENALAGMASSARSVGSGSTGNSTFTRRLKLWGQVSVRGGDACVALAGGGRLVDQDEGDASVPTLLHTTHAPTVHLFLSCFFQVAIYSEVLSFWSTVMTT